MYPIIVTIHSYRYKEFGFFDKLACELCKRKTQRLFLIAPSSTIKRELIKTGFKNDVIKELNTFIPPTDDEYNSLVPIEIESFIKYAKKRNGYVCLSSASNLYINISNEDVYGLDMCIKACIRLQYLFLVFCIPKWDENYLSLCINTIKKEGLEDRVLIYKGQVNLVPLYPLVDVFIRATVTDSYGISVEEAICSNTCAIASDVCERTDGTILFKAKDIDDLCSKIELSRQNNNIKPKRKDYLQQYVAIYDKVMDIRN